MTNSNNGIQRENNVKEQKLRMVTSFTYLISIKVTNDGPKPKVPFRIAHATVAIKAVAYMGDNSNNETDVLSCHIYTSVCLLFMELDSIL